MAGSYYGRKRPQGQMKSVTSNLMAGMNAYEKSDIIGDNQLSDALDATIDETTKAITLFTRASNGAIAGTSTGNGLVIDAICAKDSSNYEHIILITKDNADGDDVYYDDLVNYSYNGGSQVVIDISAYQFTGTYTSMCLFNTEAKRFVCFIASGVKKLLYYDLTTVTVVALPFFPKKIVSHVNRVFITDTYNKVWWCKAGDLSSWYGLEEDDDKIVTSTDMLDSGTYTIAAQPDVPRTISITVTPTSTIDTLGTLVVVGTDNDAVAQTKTYTPINGKFVSFEIWTSITSITAAGHSAVSGADKIKIGTAPISGAVTDDAGVWTLEQEYTLVDMATIGGNLYIWSPSNINVFRGDSYDTFSLSRMISNLGCLEGREISNCGNIAYFWGSADELYEFNGNDYPKVINKPVFVNGSVSNGIFGSLEVYNNCKYLTATKDSLYVYSSSSDGDTLADVDYHQQRIYEFDIKSRSWWKRSGFYLVYDPAYVYSNLYPKYIQSVGKDTTRNIMTGKVAATNSSWGIYTYMGMAYDGGSYAITKAFNDGITNDQSLTNIIIYARFTKAGPLT
jgi:hypothetical protein